jgi:hypothetical protein
MHADQIRTRRQLLQCVLPGAIRHRKRRGAAERGNDRAVERLADFIGDFAFDQAGVGDRLKLQGAFAWLRRAKSLRFGIGRVHCRKAKHQGRSDQATGGSHLQRR